MGGMEDTYIKETEGHLVHTYNRFPVVLERGEGVFLYDTEGRRYLDFAAGIAVCGLGYGNKELQDAMKRQIDLLMHTSNLYYNTACGKAAGALKRITGMDRVFFTNSGTEAIEGALKAARKYAYQKGTGRYEYIAMEHSFHGRSIGAVSVTGNSHYREPFEPMLPGVKFAKFNNLDSVKALVSDKTCAIILEPVQGEGGIHVSTEGFMQGIRKLCDEEGILMICDEIQCGMGRTGTMYAWQRYGIKPDIMTSAKAVGCGVPVGAFMMTERVAQHSLTSGDHGTTYGGNPLACAAVSRVIDLFEELDILKNVNETGAYLYEKLDALAAKYDFIRAHRGVGLMQGLECEGPVGGVINRAVEKGLLLINAGTNIIRFIPPLIVSKAEVDDMIGIVDACFAEAGSADA